VLGEGAAFIEPVRLQAGAVRTHSPNTGLTSAEAAARAARGQRNAYAARERSDRDIIRENALTFFNVVLGSLIATLLVLAVLDRDIRLLQDGLFVGLVAVANTAVGTWQEIRATHTLRALVALTAPHATVVRDGKPQRIAATDVVQDDLVRLQPGDQVVADGHVLDGLAEVDESLLTGEADAVRKQPGDALYSGSYCTAGACSYAAERVGADAYAVQLTADARTLVRRLTPLQLRFNRILRVLLTATLVLGVLLIISYNVEHRGFAESVKAATGTMTTVVPEGLLLSMTVAFAVGAVRVSRRRAIVQDISAVEALNYVDIVCLDKTGTITAGKLEVRDLAWLPNGEALRSWLGAFARDTAGESRTAEALAQALGRSANDARSVATVPFSSARRWSARTLEMDGEQRSFVLGAPELLLPARGAEAAMARYAEATEQGLRGVVLAEAMRLPDPDAPLPRLRPLLLVTLADQLRPAVKDAFTTMAGLGIEPKLISGDNPQTVAALVGQLDLTLKGGAVPGPDLEPLDDAALGEAVEANGIFGRVSPALKARIVTALRHRGHFVAMVGDGANDVRALRAADVAVAMASGTDTARGVAGIVLLDDSFEAFVAGTKEAETVLGNSARLSKLFLAKSFYAFLLIVATNMLGLNFPFLPRHGSLTALLTLGIPALFISISVPPRGAGRDFERNVLRFALPAAFALASAAIVVHLVTEGLLRRPVAEARTLVSLTVGITGLFFMLEVLGFSGASFRNPIRPVLTTILGAVLGAGLFLTLYTPWLRTFFDFTQMGIGQWIVVGLAVAAALAGQFLLSRYWQTVVDALTAKPPPEEQPRGRAV
jgi:cation-transporting ATPase E